MQWCGLSLDSGRNEAVMGNEEQISTDAARIHAYVIPSDEEIVIAGETAGVVEKSKSEAGRSGV